MEDRRDSESLFQVQVQVQVHVQVQVRVLVQAQVQVQNPGLHSWSAESISSRKVPTAELKFDSPNQYLCSCHAM